MMTKKAVFLAVAISIGVSCVAQDDWLRLSLSPQFAPFLTSLVPSCGTPAIELGCEYELPGGFSLLGRFAVAVPDFAGFYGAVTLGTRFYVGEGGAPAERGYGLFFGLYPLYRWSVFAVGRLPFFVAGVVGPSGQARMSAFEWGSSWRIVDGLGMEFFFVGMFPSDAIERGPVMFDLVFSFTLTV